MTSTRLFPQLIEMQNPVPSLELYSIKYKEKRWIFIYRLFTPHFLNEEPLSKPLYLKGALQNLTLQTTSYKNMIQIPLYTIRDFMELLKAQRVADLTFRDSFISGNEGAEARTFSLPNIDHVFNIPTYIVSIYKQLEENTEFIGAQKRIEYGKS